MKQYGTFNRVIKSKRLKKSSMGFILKLSKDVR